MAATVLLAADSAVELDTGLLVFALVLTAVATFFEVDTPGTSSLHPGLAFVFLAAILLPPVALPLLAALCFLPTSVRERVRWYRPTLHAAATVVAGLGAHVIVRETGVMDEAVGPLTVAVLAVAGILFVLVIDVLRALFVRLAWRRPLGVAARNLAANLPLDVALTTTGAALAVLWSADPWLTVFLAGPIGLVSRALLVPALRHKSQTDAKTGLFNFEHLLETLDDAVRTAARRQDTVAVVMVDLDHLRAINNRFGHLAGDQAIQRVAQALGRAAQDRGVAARFGGEEFSLLLPGFSAAAAADPHRHRAHRGGGPQLGRRRRDHALHVQRGRRRLPAGRRGSGRAAVGRRRRALRRQGRRAQPRPPRAAGRLPRGPHARPGLRRRSADRRPLRARAGRSDATGRAGRAGARAGSRAAEPVEADATGPPRARPSRARGASSRGSSPRSSWPLAGTLVISSPEAALDAPLLLLVLVAAVVALDQVRIDLFVGLNLSAASVPTLTLACLFGPFGAVAAESAIALVRFLRGEPRVKWSFDLGALSLAGAAAAGVFALLPGDTPLALRLHGHRRRAGLLRRQRRPHGDRDLRSRAASIRSRCGRRAWRGCGRTS